MDGIQFFGDGSAYQLLQTQTQKMRTEDDELKPNDILQRSDDELADFFVEQFCAILPVIADGPYDATEIEHDDRTLQSVFRVRFPYSGNGVFFRVAGPTSPVLYREALINADELVVRYVVSMNDSSTLARQTEDDIATFRDGLQQMALWIKNYNESLRNNSLEFIHSRRDRLQRHSAGLAQISALGFNLTRLDDPPARILRTVERRTIESQTRPKARLPDPSVAITDESYEDILRVIEAMATVFERSPTTFRKMHEPDLRNVLLVGLNATFKGKATGETFNGEGKSDILIIDNNTNLFLAECLIWDGADGLKKKLDEQLARYATWRDTKLALLIFNKNKDFSNVILRMKEVIEAHPLQVRSVPAYRHESGCRHVFKRQDDVKKQFTLTTLAFDILK